MTNISKAYPANVHAAITLLNRLGFFVVEQSRVGTAEAVIEISDIILHSVEVRESYENHIKRELAKQLAEFIIFQNAAEFATANGPNYTKLFTATATVIKPEVVEHTGGNDNED